MSNPPSKPQLELRGNEWFVTLPDVTEPFRVVSWRPPHLLLEHKDELRTLFVTCHEDHAWIGDNGQVIVTQRPSRRRSTADSATPLGELTSPMPGKVLQVRVSEGDAVKTGDRLVIVEAMKMENPIRAPHDGVVKKIFVEPGQSVTPGDVVIELEEPVA